MKHYRLNKKKFTNFILMALAYALLMAITGWMTIAVLTQY